MAQVKLTKNELRQQEIRLHQLRKYLPTLKLKKAMLQSEVGTAQAECRSLKEELDQLGNKLFSSSGLLDYPTYSRPEDSAQIEEVLVNHENIAGVEVPIFESVSFKKAEYSLMDTPVWQDSLVKLIKGYRRAEEYLKVADQKLKALENELREVSIRVNLFEKVLIPRALNNIKRIKIFLGDQELAAVGRAKVAKSKHLRDNDLEVAI